MEEEKEEDLENKVFAKTYHFDSCSAPLCLQASDLEDDSIWYTDEEICNANTNGRTPDWIKQQRKIAKLSKGKDVGFFTLKMLKRNCIIRTGIRGIDGDKNNVKEQKERWFKNHKPKRKRSEEEKKVSRERFKKNVLDKQSRGVRF